MRSASANRANSPGCVKLQSTLLEITLETSSQHLQVLSVRGFFLWSTADRAHFQIILVLTPIDPYL